MPKPSEQASLGGVEVVDLTEDHSSPRKMTKRKREEHADVPLHSQPKRTNRHDKPAKAATQSPSIKQPAASTSPSKIGRAKRKHQELIEAPKIETSPTKKPRRAPVDEDDKRPRRWRNKMPQQFEVIQQRALTQRMFVIDRVRDEQHPGHPVEAITMAGTTGNVYTVEIDKLPQCSCPHARKGHQCKHVVYVLSRVLRVRPELEYQLAFTARELREIFEHAPPLPSEQAKDSSHDGKRKPIEGDCPICCEDFDLSEGAEEIVYCKSSCGNNIHKSCFSQWAASKRGGTVTCPFCREVWQLDDGDIKETAKTGKVNEEGYVNVAGHFGLTGVRDRSTYHTWRNDEYWW